MFWIELLIVLVMIFIGTRKGGPFMALAGGIGTFPLLTRPSPSSVS